MAGRSRDDDTGTTDESSGTDDERGRVTPEEDPTWADGDDEWGARPDEPADDRDDGPDAEGIFGPMDEPREIEAGRPDAEHVLFVLLGILVGIVSVMDVLGLF